jgi:hypothetical protein
MEMAEAPTPTPELEAAVEPAVAAEVSGVVVSDTPVALEGHALIDTLDKDGLEAFARANFSREIDKRKKLPTLREEVKRLYDGSTQREEAEVAAVEAEVERRAVTTPTHARHRDLIDPATGENWVFEWNAHYEGNADLEPLWLE